MFSRLAGAGGCVYAFEPYPANMHLLLRHIRLNRLRNTSAIGAAVAETTGLHSMSVDFDNYRNRLCAAPGTPLLVPTISLDEFDGQPPDLIKVDVEGAESRVLSGAKRVLSEVRPLIFLALHGTDQQRECESILRGCGYDLYTLDGAKIDQRIAVDEIFAAPRVTALARPLAEIARVAHLQCRR